MNIPPVISGLKALPHITTCTGSSWLGLNLLLSFAHIAAAVYFVRTLSKPNDENGGPSIQQLSTFKKATNLVCYDSYIAGYILLLLFFMLWLGIGIARSLNGFGGSGDCPDRTGAAVVTALLCGYAFLGMGVVAFVISFCCASCGWTQQQQGGTHNVALVDGGKKDDLPVAVPILAEPIPAGRASLVSPSAPPREDVAKVKYVA